MLMCQIWQKNQQPIAHVGKHKMIEFYIIVTSVLCTRNLTDLFIQTDQKRRNFTDLYHEYCPLLNPVLNALILKQVKRTKSKKYYK